MGFLALAKPAIGIAVQPLEEILLPAPERCGGDAVQGPPELIENIFVPIRDPRARHGTLQVMEWVVVGANHPVGLCVFHCSTAQDFVLPTHRVVQLCVGVLHMRAK